MMQYAKPKDDGLKGNFSSGIEGAQASILNHDFNWKLSITRSLGPRQFVLYIRYFVISVVNKQYKT